MKERIFGTECEYALICRSVAENKIDYPNEGIFMDQIKWLNASLISCLHEEDRPLAGEFLGNGGRFYIDRGGHPEYATPECRSVKDLVVHEKAGDTMVQALVNRLRTHWEKKKESPDIHVYKNNVDFFGNSYGSHENYLITPGVMDRIHLLIPFLVTRQIFSGAGFIIHDRRQGKAEFLLAQRSMFIDKVFSDRTSGVRGIINTRKREIYHQNQNRRLHVIVGDSNMSESAIRLKIGTTTMVLRLLEEGTPEGIPTFRSPVQALKAVSRSLDSLLEIEGEEKKYKAMEIQRMYLEKVRTFFKPGDLNAEEEEILEHWAQTLDGLTRLKISTRNFELEDDPGELKKKIDWVLKFWLIGRSRERIKQTGNRAGSKIIDLKYHDLDPQTGLFHRCQDLGLVERLAGDREIMQALIEPPTNTRARIRGMIIHKAKNKNIQVVIEDWEKIQLRAVKKRPGLEHPFSRHTRLVNALKINLRDPFQTDTGPVLDDLERFFEIWS